MNYKKKILKHKKWYIVDGHNQVRAAIQGCLRTEAEACASLMFGEPGLRAAKWPELSPKQRERSGLFQVHTLNRYREVYGVDTPLDREMRERKQREYEPVVAFASGGAR